LIPGSGNAQKGGRGAPQDPNGAFQDPGAQPPGGGGKKGGGKKGAPKGGDPNAIPGAGGGKKGGKGGNPGGGFGGGFGGGGGGGFGMPDPDMVFNMLTGGSGNDFLYMNQLPAGGDVLEEWATMNGINTGALTRAQFAQYWQQTGGKGVINQLGIGAKKGSGALGSWTNGLDYTQLALMAFKELDKDGDGFLNVDEMPLRLQASIGKYNKSGNNMISFEEYKEYYKDELQRQDAAKKKGEAFETDDMDKRPTVFRAGKLPKELPDWFTQLDTDSDGQVGLYEWMRAGKAPEEFQAMDRNGDGLLTAEEYLWYMKIRPADSEGMNTKKNMAKGFGNMNAQQSQQMMQAFGKGKGGGPGGAPGGKGGGGKKGGGGGKGGGPGGFGGGEYDWSNGGW
jgi:Ca2+-binding EF-hand superfamily protein